MCKGSAQAETHSLSISFLVSQTCSLFFSTVHKNRRKQQSIVIKENRCAKVDKAMTKIYNVHQKLDLIPMKPSLVAHQKKVKRVEVLLCS
jgi:hypothetical protein